MSEREKSRDAVTDFIYGWPPRLIGNLGDMLYIVSELGLWPDYVDSVSAEQALMCWAIVQKMRAHGVPDELRL